MATAIEKFASILGTGVRETRGIVSTLQSSYNVDYAPGMSTTTILNLPTISLKYEGTEEYVHNKRIADGVRADLYMNNTSTAIKVVCRGGGTFGEIWQSPTIPTLLFKRVLPDIYEHSFEKQARTFLTECWVQTILNTDKKYGKFTSAIFKAYRDVRIVRQHIDLAQPVFFIAMEYIPYTLGELVKSGAFTATQLRGVLYSVSSYLNHFFKKYSFFHRDLHVGNIMLSDTGIKIIDFGMSCLKYEGAYYHMPVKERVLKELTNKFSGTFSSVGDCVSLDLAILLTSLMANMEKTVLLWEAKAREFAEEIRELKDEYREIESDPHILYVPGGVKARILEELKYNQRAYINCKQRRQNALNCINLLDSLLTADGVNIYNDIVATRPPPAFHSFYYFSLQDLDPDILQVILQNPAFYPNKLKEMLKQEYPGMPSRIQKLLGKSLPPGANSPERNVREAVRTIQTIRSSTGGTRKLSRKKNKTRKH